MSIDPAAKAAADYQKTLINDMLTSSVESGVEQSILINSLAEADAALSEMRLQLMTQRRQLQSALARESDLQQRLAESIALQRQQGQLCEVALEQLKEAKSSPTRVAHDPLPMAETWFPHAPPPPPPPDFFAATPPQLPPYPINGGAASLLPSSSPIARVASIERPQGAPRIARHGGGGASGGQRSNGATTTTTTLSSSSMPTPMASGVRWGPAERAAAADLLTATAAGGGGPQQPGTLPLPPPPLHPPPQPPKTPSPAAPASTTRLESPFSAACAPAARSTSASGGGTQSSSSTSLLPTSGRSAKYDEPSDSAKYVSASCSEAREQIARARRAIDSCMLATAGYVGTKHYTDFKLIDATSQSSSSSGAVAVPPPGAEPPPTEPEEPSASALVVPALFPWNDSEEAADVS